MPGSIDEELKEFCHQGVFYARILGILSIDDDEVGGRRPEVVEAT